MTPERRKEIEMISLMLTLGSGECRSTSDTMTDGAAAIEELLEALDTVVADMHEGHHMIPSATRDGWLECTAGDYATPGIGYCPKHVTLDKCWAVERPE